LNGDGLQDHLVLICYDAEAIFGYGSFGYTRFILEVLGFDMEYGRGSNLDGQVQIVDIDTTDVFKEIAVPESGPSSDDATLFFISRVIRLFPSERFLGNPSNTTASEKL
jgi:hypothetical protein